MVKVFLDWEWPAAEAALRQAIALDPGYAFSYILLGNLLSLRGAHDEGQAAMRRARELDPLSATNHAISSQVAFQARDYSAALEHARQTIVVDAGFWVGYVQRGQAYEQLGETDLALEALAQAARLSSGNSKAISIRGYVLATRGRGDEAREVLAFLQSVARAIRAALCLGPRVRGPGRAPHLSHRRSQVGFLPRRSPVRGPRGPMRLHVGGAPGPSELTLPRGDPRGDAGDG